MAFEIKWATLPLLAALASACSDLESPADRPSGAGGGGESMSALESEGGGSSGEPSRPPSARRSCPLGEQTYLDGSSIPSGDRCTRCTCDDGTIACAAAACEPVACDPFLVAADGVCSPAALDPCRSQDPDCGSGAEAGPDAGGAVDAGSGSEVGDGACEVAGQSFPDQSDVPSGDDCNTCACNDGALVCSQNVCDLVFCAELIEEPDGVCSRFPLDPCSSQDPDCRAEPVATDP